MAFFGKFLATSAVMRSKPEDLLSGNFYTRNFVSTGEKDFSRGEVSRRSLRTMLTMFVFFIYNI